MSLTIQGRFFIRNGERHFLRAVTYGPFPPGKELDDALELKRIAQAGFNAVRTYEKPSKCFLDLLAANDLVLLATIPWYWDSLFLENRETLRDAKKAWGGFLAEHKNHPALGVLLVANEIRPDLVRFMGPAKVREALEDLIAHCRRYAPDLPCGYASFPTTEYLEPGNADFTAFNIYLEQQENFAAYLRRLHNIAGDRPLLLTEFGLHADSPESDGRQASTLAWALQTARSEAAAGFTVYSWSDRWFNGGHEIHDWSFGITRRDGSAKPALDALESFSFEKPKFLQEKISVAICTRNGAQRLFENLASFLELEDENFELLIVDDGSDDDLQAVVDDFSPQASFPIRYLRQKPLGLSAARNHAAREADGAIVAYLDDDARPAPQWLSYLRRAFAENQNAAAAGGPNLAPAPSSLQNALVTACPGNASHVLLTDTTAEHLPGCNLAVRRDLLLEAEGFDTQFHTAGDDIDLCWRLLDAGYELAFHPAACVFHDRRPDISGYLRQQRGYGHAEGLLSLKHPQRFVNNEIQWEGVIYTGSSLIPDEHAVIYHGPLGSAPYQGLNPRMMPIRPLAPRYNSTLAQKLTVLLHRYARRARRKEREKLSGVPKKSKHPNRAIIDHLTSDSRRDYDLSAAASREGVLAQLQTHNWTVSRDEANADLERGPLKLISAVTPAADGPDQLHIRLIHPPIDLQEVWKEIESAIAKGG